MTDIPSQVERVLRLDKEAPKGPWAADWGRVRDDNCGTICLHPSECYAVSPEWEASKNLIAEYRTAAPILATEVTRLRAELETERRKVEGLRKELHDVRSVCTEALNRLEETEEVYKPREDANYWRWEGTGEGLAGIEWDVTTPLTADALAPSEKGEL